MFDYFILLSLITTPQMSVLKKIQTNLQQKNTSSKLKKIELCDILISTSSAPHIHYTSYLFHIQSCVCH